jgi:signal transduction histidine kinase
VGETPDGGPAPPVEPTLVRFREARRAWDEVRQEGEQQTVESDIRARYALKLPEPPPAKRSLFRRLLITMSAVLAIFGGLMLLLGWRLGATVLSDVLGSDLLEPQLTALEGALAPALAANLPPAEMQGHLARRYGQHVRLTIAVYGRDGARLAQKVGSPGPAPSRLVAEAAQNAVANGPQRETESFTHQALLAVRTQTLGASTPGSLVGWVYVASDASTVRTRDLVLELSWKWGLPIFLLAMLAAFLGTRSITERLRGAEQRVRRMAAGDMSARIPIEEMDEVGRLALAFNTTAALLERTVRDLESTDSNRRRLIADFAHELNTPLTNVLAYLESLIISEEDGSMDAATRMNFLQVAHDEAKRLAHLARDLETLTKLEGGRLTMDRSVVSLSAVGESIAERIRPRCEQSGLRLEHSITPGVVCLGDRMRLEQVGMNLLGNALRYTERGSVHVGVFLDDDEVCLAITDTGIGIPEDALDQVMDRFYRVDPSRNRSTGGSGLGLAIVGGIVGRHQGRVTITSQEGHGSTFTVRLPRPDGDGTATLPG